MEEVCLEIPGIKEACQEVCQEVAGMDNNFLEIAGNIRIVCQEVCQGIWEVAIPVGCLDLDGLVLVLETLTVIFNCF